MKSLRDYIFESSSDYRFVKVRLYDDDASADAIKKVTSAAFRNDIYMEKIDHGFKLKISAGKNVDEITDILNELIENIPEDKQAVLSKVTDKLRDSIEDIQNAASPDDGE